MFIGEPEIPTVGLVVGFLGEKGGGGADALAVLFGGLLPLAEVT